ncbi:hypothetical protein B0H14DRAFT_2651788 [Mycena olivaceomarginata]|nr:hypothetical protein B0H14DRAFT_2651788 [Mycena olivaceomarginata]
MVDNSEDTTGSNMSSPILAVVLVVLTLLTTASAICVYVLGTEGLGIVTNSSEKSLGIVDNGGEKSLGIVDNGNEKSLGIVDNSELNYTMSGASGLDVVNGRVP